MSPEQDTPAIDRADVQRVARLARLVLSDAEVAALAQARASDARRRAGQPLSAWDGVPMALKDIFLTAGLPTTCGSNILRDFVAPYDGTVVRQLKAAGIVLLGKLNMDEFAMGSS